MCGISAYFDVCKGCRTGSSAQFNNDRTLWKQRLDRSVETMRHRGPDSKGTWISSHNRAGLGHVRLSTRDLTSTGHQPLHSADTEDDIHAIVNGELYYDEDLRRSLGEQYKFQSTSDSELVIALYKVFGDSFVHHLRGEFSLVVYDQLEGKLVAARDRFGVKPLHYSTYDGQILVATQGKGIVELLDKRERLQWDEHCLAQGGGHYGARTLFEGIMKFPPGHYLVVRHDQIQSLEFTPYWQSKFPPNFGNDDARSTKEITCELRARLLEAVRIRLESSDVAVGVLLSGGVDSSAVAGMVAYLSRQRMASGEANVPLPTCFTIGFPDDNDLDESAVAARTAQHLGLPIEKIIVTEDMLADEFEEACWLGEALMWDLQHIAKKALSRHICRRGFKVVLNGDGSDELFGGYPYFVADRLLDDDKRRPASLQEASTAQREHVQQDYTKSFQWFGGDDSSGDTHDCDEARALKLPPAFCKYAVSRHDSWLKEEVRNLSSPFEAIQGVFSEQEAAQMADYHPLHRAMAAWNKTVLPNMVIAAISDGAEMAHSIESRPPFLDHVVAEYAQSLPVDMLVHLNGEDAPVEKWIFREAVRPFVPDEVYKKRKHAFAAPFRFQIGGPLYKKLSSLITQENVEGLGFVQWNTCHDIVDRSFAEKNQLLFRQCIWLAQIVSMGLQFGIQAWASPMIFNEKPSGHVAGQRRSNVEQELEQMAQWLPQSFL